MKKVWVDCRPWSKKKVLAALENGADAVVIPAGKSKLVAQLGRLKTVSPDGDLKLGRKVVEIEIKGKEDEERALAQSRERTVIVRSRDWKIIPLENLIAQSDSIMAEVSSPEEAKTALKILEKGVAGVLIKSGDLARIKKIIRLVKSGREKIALEKVKIREIRELGMGDRVCVDTCTNMKMGEGILVGNTSSAFFLVHSESVRNPYVEPRPFRVNAGGVHAYTVLPGGRTAYLSEISIGDEILVVGAKGRTQNAVVGRVKIEKRPMLLVRAARGKREVSLVLQNAETIRLVRPAGRPVSVVELGKGEEVLAYFEEGGRHFGIKVKESITEK